MKFNTSISALIKLVSYALVGPLLLMGSQLASADGKKSKYDFGSGKPHATHIKEARGYPFCEILFIHKEADKVVAAVYNTSGASTCPLDKFNALDAKALAAEYGVDAVFKNVRRHWMMDEFWLYTTREIKDFHGLKAGWMATLQMGGALGGLGKADRFPKYAPSQIQRKSEYLYKKGSEVYLIDDADGHTWIMQTWTDKIYPEMSEAALPKLGSMYKKLPDGWKVRFKTLDKDLTVAPPADKDHMAWVMADEFNNVYEGCGYDSACSYMP